MLLSDYNRLDIQKACDRMFAAKKDGKTSIGNLTESVTYEPPPTRTRSTTYKFGIRYDEQEKAFIKTITFPYCLDAMSMVCWYEKIMDEGVTISNATSNK